MNAEGLWAAYVREVVRLVTPGADQAAVASRAKVSQGTVSRWLSGRYLPDKAAVVGHFAREYHRNVLEAFVAAGMLTEDEAGAGLPGQSRWFLHSLSAPRDELPAVAESGPLEGSGEEGSI